MLIALAKELATALHIGYWKYFKLMAKVDDVRPCKFLRGMMCKTGNAKRCVPVGRAACYYFTYYMVGGILLETSPLGDSCMSLCR